MFLGIRKITLSLIIAATVAGGLLSVLAAAFVSFKLLDSLVPRLVSLAAGLLLGVAFLHLLPEAFESNAGAHALSATLLAGVLVFFLLEKASLWRHSHHHEHDGHHHEHGFDAHEAGRSGLLILVGDGIHNFADGILIAAAFMTDVKLGIITTIGIAAHEIPQEIGDFMILLNAGFSRSRALVYNAISSLTAVLGGVLGYFLLDALSGWMPFVLMLAAASFLYIAIADLMPEMQRARDTKSNLWQISMVGLGIGIVAISNSLAH